MKLDQIKLIKSKIKNSPVNYSVVIILGWLLILIVLAVLLRPLVIRLIWPNNFSQPIQPIQPIQQIDEPFTGQLYFNDQLGQNLLSSLVIDLVNQAQESIELSLYSFGDENIRDSLYRAADRGVLIKMILSDKRQAIHDRIFADMPSNMVRLDIASDKGYMHHKFLLVDRGRPTGQLLFSSYNFTKLQDKYDPSFLLISQRLELIDSFGREFDRLLSGQQGRAKLAAGQGYLVDSFNYPNGFLEIWFPPQSGRSGLKNRMISLIKSVKKNIKGMTWHFTDQQIAKELLTIARQYPVSIIVDDFNWDEPDSVKNTLEVNYLPKLDILTDAKRNQEISQVFNEPELNSFLHHHLLIVDDNIAIFGTNNWSAGGFFRNDESVIISNIDLLVDPFRQSFLFNYEKNK